MNIPGRHAGTRPQVVQKHCEPRLSGAQSSFSKSISKPSSAVTRIGTASRFSSYNTTNMVGPNTHGKSSFGEGPGYTMASNLVKLQPSYCSSPGPSLSTNNNTTFSKQILSTRNSSSKATFGSSGRTNFGMTTPAPRQYTMPGGIGKQASSRRRTGGSASFGTSTRDDHLKRAV